MVPNDPNYKILPNGKAALGPLDGYRQCFVRLAPEHRDIRQSTKRAESLLSFHR